MPLHSSNLRFRDMSFTVILYDEGIPRMLIAAKWNFWKDSRNRDDLRIFGLFYFYRHTFSKAQFG